MGFSLKKPWFIKLGIIVVGVALVVGLCFRLWPCGEGFTGRGVGNCQDIVECAVGSHDCHENAICTNTIGSWVCACKVGYVWMHSSQECVDVDECDLGMSFNF